MSEGKSPLEGKKLVRLDDGRTIIYIDKDENPEKAIAKYLKDLEEYPKSSVMLFNKGRAKKKK